MSIKCKILGHKYKYVENFEADCYEFKCTRCGHWAYRWWNKYYFEERGLTIVDKFWRLIYRIKKGLFR